MKMTTWTDAPLVALDLEGSGAQDHDDEAILEIAIVPITSGRPSLTDSYATLINPRRVIPQRPWISPGLTTKTLAAAPPLPDVAPGLTARLNGKVIVGHNIGVDWRLLHRHCPEIQPAALIDTLRLARHIHPGTKSKSLTALLDHYRLTTAVSELTPSSQPHRALWDTTGTALLLTELVNELPDGPTLSLDDLTHIAGYPASNDRRRDARGSQLSLLET
jgi:DNA polymerase-3 subunit epsilon/exodeoxyribonuclease X